jgi:hypothetical protein
LAETIIRSVVEAFRRERRTPRCENVQKSGKAAALSWVKQTHPIAE